MLPRFLRFVAPSERAVNFGFDDAVLTSRRWRSKSTVPFEDAAVDDRRLRGDKSRSLYEFVSGLVAASCPAAIAVFWRPLFLDGSCASAVGIAPSNVSPESALSGLPLTQLLDSCGCDVEAFVQL